MVFFPVFAAIHPRPFTLSLEGCPVPLPTAICMSNCPWCPIIPLSFPCNSFRMNTCESVSIQMTSTPLRINTYGKHRGGGGRASVFLTKSFTLALNSLLARSHTLFARSFHSFTKECLRTPLQPTRSTLFFKTAGCICISNQILNQELVEDSDRVPERLGARRRTVASD
jgi:hypothetical protein